MLYILFSLNALLMIALPLVLIFILARRFGLGWGLAGVGALTFIGSQVVHLPLLWGLDWVVDRYLAIPESWGLLFNAIVLGLLAGLCEEIARYIVIARFLRNTRSWAQGLMFGAGHGGIEAIILGLLAGLAFAQMIALRNMDLASLPDLTPEHVALLQKQITDFWATPWYGALLGALERVFAIIFHISATLLVLQAFNRRNNWWLVAAILWHTVLDAFVVWAVSSWGIYWTEALLGVLSIISFGIIVALRRSGMGAASSSDTADNGVPTSTG